MNIGYNIFGADVENFVLSLSSQEIPLHLIKKKSDESFYVEINSTNKKKFESLVNDKNFSFKEVKISHKEFVKRFAKNNITFILISILILLTTFFSNLFVFSIHIYGLENVKEEDVLSLLAKNGYTKYRLKSHFDLENVCYLIRNNENNVSFVSAVIVGSSLVINVNEKIDTSPYIYDYTPVVAPVDCIINSISFTSGTKLKSLGETVKEGDIIVAPYIMGASQDKIPVPAKAQVEAKFDLSSTFAKNQDSKIMIEKNKNMLYNKISNLNLTSNVEEIVTEFVVDNAEYITVTIIGNFIFN